MPIDTNEIGGFVAHCTNEAYLLGLLAHLEARIEQLRPARDPENLAAEQANEVKHGRIMRRVSTALAQAIAHDAVHLVPCVRKKLEGVGLDMPAAFYGMLQWFDDQASELLRRTPPTLRPVPVDEGVVEGVVHADNGIDYAPPEVLNAAVDQVIAAAQEKVALHGGKTVEVESLTPVAVDAAGNVTAVPTTPQPDTSDTPSSTVVLASEQAAHDEREPLPSRAVATEAEVTAASANRKTRRAAQRK